MPRTFLVQNSSSFMCILYAYSHVITMHRETVISKISLLVNLEKTNMNPLHTYTLYAQTSCSVNIPNLSYLQTLHFLCWGLT